MFDLNIPFNLIEECSQLDSKNLGSKVRNRVIFSNDDFIIMAVIGPNSRSDYHVNSKQIKGDMELKTIRNANVEVVKINEGTCYLLDREIPHQPVRKANSIGIVIESARRENEKDSLIWFCKKCFQPLHKIDFTINRMDKDLESEIVNFEKENAESYCKKCQKYFN